MKGSEPNLWRFASASGALTGLPPRVHDDDLHFWLQYGFLSAFRPSATWLKRALHLDTALLGSRMLWSWSTSGTRLFLNAYIAGDAQYHTYLITLSFKDMTVLAQQARTPLS